MFFIILPRKITSSKINKKVNYMLPQAQKLAFLIVLSITLFSCGDGSSTSDPGTSTTMVTSFNGQPALPGKGQQYIEPVLAAAGGLTNGMLQVSTSWTDLNTNIITISKIPFVDGSNSATYYAAAGSVLV